MEDTRSVHSKAPSQAPSHTSSVSVGHKKRMEEEAKRQEEMLEQVRSKYVSIIDKDEKKYNTKMVGLNPNMRPTANQSLKKIFPMQGLWPAKNLMKSTNNDLNVTEADQVEHCE